MLIDGKDRLIYFSELFAAYLQSRVDDHISNTDTMVNEWYMTVGASGARVVYGACVTSWLGKVSSVLDLPCGHGRVLRHLVQLFPQASFDAADLDHEGVDFCAQRFGARPIYSQEDLTRVDFGKKYDLIWVGSLFTHVSQDRMRAWLAHLSSFLAEGGIMVATFHGRYSALKGLEFGYIEKTRWQKVLRDYEATGYGYADYPPKAGHAYMEGAYGVSLSKPEVILADVAAIPDIRVFNYTERGWAGHQDVLVIGKPDISWTG
jgi:SAM-dependent methyltransferase